MVIYDILKGALKYWRDCDILCQQKKEDKREWNQMINVHYPRMTWESEVRYTLRDNKQLLY